MTTRITKEKIHELHPRSLWNGGVFLFDPVDPHGSALPMIGYPIGVADPRMATSRQGIIYTITHLPFITGPTSYCKYYSSHIQTKLSKSN